MKTFWIKLIVAFLLLVGLLGFAVFAQDRQYQPASQTEVNAGVNTFKGVTPATLKGWTGGGGGGGFTPSANQTNVLNYGITNSLIRGTNYIIGFGANPTNSELFDPFGNFLNFYGSQNGPGFTLSAGNGMSIGTTAGGLAISTSLTVAGSVTASSYQGLTINFAQVPATVGGRAFDLVGQYNGCDSNFWTLGSITAGSGLLTVLSTNGIFPGMGIWVSNAGLQGSRYSNMIATVALMIDSTHILLTNGMDLYYAISGIASNTVTSVPVRPDNSIALNFCLSNCVTHGANKVWLRGSYPGTPDQGYYAINGPVDKTNGNAVVALPYNTNYNQYQGIGPFVTIIGDGQAGVYTNNATGLVWTNNGGTYIDALNSVSNGNFSAVFGSGLNNATLVNNNNTYVTNFNPINFQFEGLTINTLAGSGMGGINGANAANLSVKDLVVYHTLQNGTIFSTTPQDGSVGIFFPLNYNWTRNKMDHVNVAGFDDLIRVSDNTEILGSSSLEYGEHGIDLMTSAEGVMGQVTIQAIMGGGAYVYADPTATECGLHLFITGEEGASPWTSTTGYSDISEIGRGTIDYFHDSFSQSAWSIVGGAGVLLHNLANYQNGFSDKGIWAGTNLSSVFWVQTLVYTNASVVYTNLAPANAVTPVLWEGHTNLSTGLVYKTPLYQ